MDTSADGHDENGQSPLRRGWTTGACATAAARSALSALLTGNSEDPVTITLPGGQRPAFALAHELIGDDFAEAGIIKDAGDDPDVTHGALVIARVSHGPQGSGITFRAGSGVGTVTKPGLKLAVGEPAINPVPRQMITAELLDLCTAHGVAPDFVVTISVRDGERLAEKTWNPRLGILGGLSILGTTGIVIPYSCGAWIASIHRGIDVARAMGLPHLVGSTGDVSEKAAQGKYALPLEAYLDMGDFVGGMLKYLKAHPVERITIAGGFAKLSKLANGAMDLHSGRSQVDTDFLASILAKLGASAALLTAAGEASSAGAVLDLAATENLPLAQSIAEEAKVAAARVLNNSGIQIGILVVGRDGAVLGEN